MRGIRCFMCVLTLVASSFAARAVEPPAETPSSSKPKAAYPNVILITMDTTRADRMGFLGSKLGLTPNLDRLARESAVFTRAYTQAPLTPSSHATILSGTYPQYHQVLSFPLPLAKTVPYLPEILGTYGYHTGAFVGSMALDPKWGVPGFDRGFDTYYTGFHPGPSGGDRYHTVEWRAGEVVKHAMGWLHKRPPGPFFVWVHMFDPHDPYDPPEPYKTRYAKAPYNGEIAYMDSALGNLFRQLKAAGLFDGSLIAVTADHGESLGAHGENQHGILLYDETTHVPLIIKLPHGQAAGKRVENMVELADIMPTVLGSLGFPVPEKVQGQSLLGFLEPATPKGEAAAKAWQDRGAYSEGDYGHLAFAWSATQSLRTGKYLYIEAPRRELYDEVNDPGAEHNLASASPAVADTLSARLKDFLQRTTNTAERPKAVITEGQTHELTALGYIARVDNPALAASPEHGADPKDKVGLVNALNQINDMLQAHNCRGAIPLLQKAIAEDTNIALFHFFYGGCYLEAEDYERAAPELSRAVQLDPGFTHAEMQLGRAWWRLRKDPEATTAFADVVKAEPSNLDAHIYLIVLYRRAHRVQDEIRECRAVLATIPDNYGANFHLGRALLETGDFKDAIRPLQIAIQDKPDRPEPHMVLSDVYLKLGMQAEAEREHAEAVDLGALPESPQTEPGAGPENPDNK
jgi:arylsulfatase A-like enzyme/cytochrome c-type biogenesis protein CcmH/NrfG